MPRGDGTGPMGSGAMTGRGLGTCLQASTAAYGAGMRRGLGQGCRGGFGRGFGMNQNSTKTQKEILENQREILKSRLDIIDAKLGEL